MFSNWYKSNPLRRIRFVDLGGSTRDAKAQFYVWVVGKPDEVHGPYRTLKSAKTFARIGATHGAHDRAVTRGRNPKNVVRYYQAGTGASLVHENPARQEQVYRVKVHTGPTQVAHYAQKLRKLKFKNVAEGTEHVYGDISILTDADTAHTKDKLVTAVAWALFNSTGVLARRGITVTKR